MKYHLDDIIALYKKLLEEVNVAEASVIIFTALDVDALCCLKMFSKLFQTQNIQYKIYPASSYQELERKIQDTKKYEGQIKLFLFINCGGIIDLTKQWLTKNPQSQVHLFDVNKPINHANIESENIKIVDDDQSGLALAPSTYEVEIFQNLNDEELEEGQEGQNQDSDQDDIAPKRRRGRNAEINKFDKIKKYKNMISDKVTAYYGDKFFGLPSSFLAYRLIRQLNKQNNDFLWYGIVGLTAMFLQHKIKRDQFEDITNNFYKPDMAKFNHQQEKPQKGSLKRILQFQFPLLRHWSLYESIENSSYMVAKLGLWQKPGKDKLHELLNKLCISIEDAKQLFKLLTGQKVRKLEQQIFPCAQNKRFDILDVAFDSFSKQIDYCSQFSASDYYYALLASLERPPQNSNLSESQLIEERKSNFLQAYTLFEEQQSIVEKRIKQEKEILKILIRESKNIIQRNHIMNGQHFSFVNVSNEQVQKKIFEHPATLVRLAYTLMYMNKEKKRMKTPKPFITSLQNGTTKNSTLVGVMTENKNPFNNKFNSVVEKLELSQVKLDSFIGNVMVIPTQMMIKVVRELGEM